ncbi:hypothetical protein [Natrinema altunense]|uniref:Uncharacterized protein n=1 Tax=Natrinema altunense (strain JCM 12890 / CGMCC 1.3731 / AJ2) TaxID=1227494 RepID=L9ZAW0_NATA2|nr:hypothetical protein [Natrinema altunense]ELY83610.1 hypothetical protein C485_17697 [Natrinema altunense JCM 12890]
MEFDDEVLEGPVRYEDKGLAARLTYNEERESYRVEYSPILKSGDIAEEWELFGGSVGYTSSEYDAEEEARAFYDELENLSNEEIHDEMSVGENQ